MGDSNEKEAKEVGCDYGAAFIWLRTWSNSGLLWTLMNLLVP